MSLSLPKTQGCVLKFTHHIKPTSLPLKVFSFLLQAVLFYSLFTFCEADVKMTD